MAGWGRESISEGSAEKQDQEDIQNIEIPVSPLCVCVCVCVRERQSKEVAHIMLEDEKTQDLQSRQRGPLLSQIPCRRQ